jgi:hypothetical protein
MTKETSMRMLLRIALIVLVAFAVASCSAIAGIFKAGVWVGIVIAVVVVVGIFALVGRG